MANQINFSDRAKPRRDLHSWQDRPGAIIYYAEDGRTVKVKELVMHVCCECGLALVVRPEHEHDLPPCRSNGSKTG